MTDENPNRIPLPRGQWAELRPRLKVAGRDLLQRHSLEMAAVLPKVGRLAELGDAAQTSIEAGDILSAGEQLESVEAVGLTAENMAQMQRFQHAAIVAWVAQWSFPFPVSIESLGELDVDEYDALIAECGPRSMQFMAEQGQWGPDGAPDPGSPTPPSGATGSGSEGSSSTPGPATAG